jgi:hypothetical protein
MSDLEVESEAALDLVLGAVALVAVVDQQRADFGLEEVRAGGVCDG